MVRPCSTTQTCLPLLPILVIQLDFFSIIQTVIKLRETPSGPGTMAKRQFTF